MGSMSKQIETCPVSLPDLVAKQDTFVDPSFGPGQGTT